ncbi:MAG: hypothetical protein FWH57_02170 [Oscillospiraceae bacterium]|nr:hypothetical protein [Oscillospiraceae bacterium]
MRRANSSIKVDYNSEKGIDNSDRTFFAYVPLDDMACYAVAESYDGDKDINSAKLAVESVLTAFERNPSFRGLRQYIKYAHDQIVANSVKNKLEAAITVVITDYTRIRYASCGNIKLYLLSDNAFYLKSETQTYYQHAANIFGLDKAPISENKNLLQYLGKKNRLAPYISKKIDLLEESTMLFATCGFWERVDDVEILDAYEESEPDNLISNIQEMHLLTQLKDPLLKSYTLASLFVEKTFKEDTAKLKKRRRLLMIAIAAAVIITIIVAIVISIIRSSDRRAMAEIERLDGEGVRYSNYGNYQLAFDQYDKALELTGKLRNNLQYTQAKKALTSMIAERWHLYNSIQIGDEHFLNGDYQLALQSYEDAQNAYYDVYETADVYSGLMVGEILSGKIERVGNYITASELIKAGQLYDIEELYQEALAIFGEAEEIVKTMGDLELRKELISMIYETERKLNSSVEVNFIRNVQSLMKRAEDRMDFDLALQYCNFIIGVYSDLGVSDDQSQADKERLESKQRNDQEVREYIATAKSQESSGNIEGALETYDTVLAIYEEMGMSQRHERYINAIEEQVRLEKIITEQREQQQQQELEDQLAAQDALVNQGIETEVGDG